jgi:hypothetical protein
MSGKVYRSERERWSTLGNVNKHTEPNVKRGNRLELKAVSKITTLCDCHNYEHIPQSKYERHPMLLFLDLLEQTQKQVIHHILAYEWLDGWMDGWTVCKLLAIPAE